MDIVQHGMIFTTQDSYVWLLIFVLSGFFAGYVDAIAGGGGMIQLPILLLSGLPPVMSLATNKIVSMAGTSIAVFRYTIHKKIIWRIALIAIIPCLVASYFGGLLAMKIPTWILEWLIILCIPIALFITLRKRHDQQKENIEYAKFKIISSVTPIGFYDGLLGPGTGSYMMIALHRFLHINYLHATAITKPLNLATNLGAAIAFLIAEKVVWKIALPMLLANAVGAWVGSHYAIKGGQDFIRKVLISVLVVMLFANIIKLTTNIIDFN